VSDDRDLNGPVIQSISIGFRVLYAAIGLLAAAWVASNWRQVPADSQAVVNTMRSFMAGRSRRVRRG